MTPTCSRVSQAQITYALVRHHAATSMTSRSSYDTWRAAQGTEACLPSSSTIITASGSWRAASEAAGLAVSAAGRRIGSGHWSEERIDQALLKVMRDLGCGAPTSLIESRLAKTGGPGMRTVRRNETLSSRLSRLRAMLGE